jgi:hypothetical protein
MSNPKKQNKMDLSNFKKTVYSPVERDEIGTVREVLKAMYGDEGQMQAHRKSLTSTKKFAVKLFDSSDSNEWVTVLCSKSVSDLLRSKELQLTQVLDFPIVNHVVGDEYENAGLVMQLIVLPSTTVTGDLPTVGVNDVANEAFAPTFNPSELIAL